MGADYTAYAVIGLRLDADKIKGIMACEHERPARAKFCPECGKPVSKYDEVERTLAGYKVIFGTNGEDAYVCIATTGEDTHSNGGESEQKTGLPRDLDKAKEMMRDTLGPLGLWDEKAFGLWAVLYCSV